MSDIITELWDAFNDIYFVDATHTYTNSIRNTVYFSYNICQEI